MKESEITIHPTAVIDAGAQIGPGTKVWHFSHICGGAVIGKQCVLGQNVYVAPRAHLGDGVRVQNNVSIYDEVFLEDDVFCGPSCVFTNVINPRSHVSRKHEYKKTVAKKGATIGANATIVCGVTLGEYSFVAAGAVVTGDVKPYELVMGVPARHGGWFCICGHRLQNASSKEFKCTQCEKVYRLNNLDQLDVIGN